MKTSQPTKLVGLNQDPKNEEFKEFKRIKQKFLAKDKSGQLVFLADSDFSIQMTQSKFPTVKLRFTSEEIVS